MLGSWGDKEGILEFSKSREIRKTGRWRLDTDGVGEGVGIFGSRQVNGRSCLQQCRSKFNQVTGSRINFDLLDAAGVLQLGFDGNPRFLYLCSE